MRDEGTYLDKETNALYNWWRYRDLDAGRFIQADPLGLRGGDLSLYVLRGNNPLSYTDPRGLLLTGVHGMMRQMTPSSAVAASVVGTGPASLVATPVQQIVNAVLPKNECELACYVTLPRFCWRKAGGNSADQRSSGHWWRLLRLPESQVRP